MKTILIATSFMILYEISFAQNIRISNEFKQELHCKIFQLTNLKNSQTNFFSQKNQHSLFNWKEGWNQHPTRKIIGGSAFILLGAAGMVEAFTPNTNYEDPYNSRIEQIGTVGISAILLSSGTVFLIRGINLKRQNKLKLTTSKNGIGLIYRI